VSQSSTLVALIVIAIASPVVAVKAAVGGTAKADDAVPSDEQR
jgi:hypothetical protein